MDLSINTPALLFPAVSFLLLAYTNRYMAISNRIRALLSEVATTEDTIAARQIDVLRSRIGLIRQMQLFAVTGILSSVLSMAALFFEWQTAGEVLFMLALVLVAGSLISGILDIGRSTEALELQLEAAGFGPHRARRRSLF